MASAVQLYCVQCGAPHPLYAQFCRICGSKMTQEHTHDHVKIDMEVYQEIEPLAPDSMLKERYRIIAKIGEGGYGDVYKAVDVEFGERKVAIKEMIQRGLDPQELEQAASAFKQEAYMLAGLTHQNLPGIYDYFTEQGRWYLVMSFIEGETLETYLQRAPKGHIPPEKVIHIGIQLAAVLSYLHTRNPPIIFRDLKPANIMRTNDGQIYLIDFGIARHFKVGQSKDTVVLGSPGYAAPEQYGHSQTTPQTDVYSLGSTLHQLLTGDDPAARPFHYVPLTIEEYPQLNPLIMCMLDRDIKKRPVSMGNIKRELQRIVTGKSPLPRDVAQGSPMFRSGQVIQQAPEPVRALVPQSAHIPAVQAPVVLPVNAGFQSLTWSPDCRYLALANAQSVVQIIDAHTQKLFTTYTAAPGTIITAASWSPDGRRLAASCSDGTVRTFDTTAPLQAAPYPAHSHPVEMVAWSPNGKYIASADDRGLIHVWNAFTRNTGTIYRQHIGRVHTLSWSPDSWHLLSAGIDRSVHVWHAISGMQTFMFHLDTVHAVAWSPNGRYIAAATANMVYVWHALDGRPVYTYGKHKSTVYTLAWSPDSHYIASAGSDKIVRVWNIVNGHSIRKYTAHKGKISTVSWSPDGASIASGDTEGVLRIWSPQ